MCNHQKDLIEGVLTVSFVMLLIVLGGIVVFECLLFGEQGELFRVLNTVLQC